MDDSWGTEPSGSRLPAPFPLLFTWGKIQVIYSKRKAELTAPWLFLAIPAGAALQEQAGGKPNSSPLSEMKHFTFS